MKILVVDDEALLVKGIRFNLQNDGYDVISGSNGEEAVQMAKEHKPDLIILDVMMPVMDGLAACAHIREFSNVPVILLTAKADDMDKLMGFEQGADDYLTKPFKPIMLSAKINALMRRIRFENEDRSTDKKTDLICGNVRYSYVKHELAVNDRPLSLTPTELKFLIYMMEHFEEAVSKEVVLETIWDINHDIESRVADETNRRLRRKMTAAGADIYVQTVWGYGFKLTKRGER